MDNDDNELSKENLKNEALNKGVDLKRLIFADQLCFR